MLPSNRKRFPHLTRRYALALSELPGAVMLNREFYRLWLNPSERLFVLLEQEPTEECLATGGPGRCDGGDLLSAVGWGEWVANHNY